MSDLHDLDERLVAELRTLFSRVDPVPPLVAEAAKAALGWRRLDADLAELLADSTLEAPTRAGVRGAGAAVRSVSFGAGELTIDLQIAHDHGQLMLLGVLTPPLTGKVEIQTADGVVAASADLDATGRFRTQLSAAGRIRLRLVGPDPGRAAPVETSWITV